MDLGQASSIVVMYVARDSLQGHSICEIVVEMTPSILSRLRPFFSSPSSGGGGEFYIRLRVACCSRLFFPSKEIAFGTSSGSNGRSGVLSVEGGSSAAYLKKTDASISQSETVTVLFFSCPLPRIIYISREGGGGMQEE